MGDPSTWCDAFYKMFFFFFIFFLFDLVVLLTLCIFRFVVKEHPELKSRFERRVQEAIKYASTIEDFDELVDLRTLARHCLGPKPSLYVLRAIDREERKHELP